MKRLKTIFLQLIKGISMAVMRFPFTVICLVSTAALICYLITLRTQPSILIEKWVFTLVVGALLGMVAQFTLERFVKPFKSYALVYGTAILLTIGYFALIWSAPVINWEIGTRTLVAVISMICAVLWIPSLKEKADFNRVALVHFKSFFTSILYSGVISAGLAAIIFAIETLLIPVNDDSYSYMLTIVWVVFAPVFFLSLLPKFNPVSIEEKEASERVSNYPRILEILVSYISIPLFTVYTLVLTAYFVKILVSQDWPAGQLGPMVLAYSIIGLILFVLASSLDNRFAVLFRIIFPKVWIPVVIMQLVSVWIRLDAYGITESRYYVALFGIFSIIAGILLSFRPVSKNHTIALLVACFAIFSIIPPVDAFTVSRNSQIGRLETYLQAEGILKDGKLTPNENASENTKIEVTNILNYLDTHSSLEYISWLPEDFKLYIDMKTLMGFDPAYPAYPGAGSEYFYATLDTGIPLDISGYDISVIIQSSRFMGQNDNIIYTFTVRGIDYELISSRLSENILKVSVVDKNKNELISSDLFEYAKKIQKIDGPQKEIYSPDLLTFVNEKNGYSLKVIFQNVSISYGNLQEAGADYTAYVLFKAPAGNQ